jgi:hypothetical protein
MRRCEASRGGILEDGVSGRAYAGGIGYKLWLVSLDMHAVGRWAPFVTLAAGSGPTIAPFNGTSWHVCLPAIYRCSACPMACCNASCR